VVWVAGLKQAARRPVRRPAERPSGTDPDLTPVANSCERFCESGLGERGRDTEEEKNMVAAAESIAAKK